MSGYLVIIQLPFISPKQRKKKNGVLLLTPIANAAPLHKLEITLYWSVTCIGHYIEQKVGQFGKKKQLELGSLCEYKYDTLKAMYLNKSLLEFYCIYVSKEEFPNLKTYTLWSSVFESTYQCKQFFSQLNITKSRYRTKLEDKDLSYPLRVAAWLV